jgi:pyruvate,orthophosphate dikinase
MGEKYVYFFSKNNAEGSAEMKALLGGKGANLAEMCNLGIPVPPGFTITTKACLEYLNLGEKFPTGLEDEVKNNLARLEKILKAQFGGEEQPLLVSVRSGAVISMPGMMDTVLNIGINDKIVTALAHEFDDERFPYDSYRRFIQMFGDVVMGIDKDLFEAALEDIKENKGVTLDTELNAEDLKNIVQEFKKIYREVIGKAFPEDPHEQLQLAIAAVFKSWNNKRAIKYREINNIPEGLGTAVNIQAMVFGNLNNKSATGVAFTRDPATGEKHFYGEYLLNAQGEDVVAGIRTPQPINIKQKTTENQVSLEETMPELYHQLVDIYTTLENHYKEMQDLEFTIQNGELFLLQTRTGKRTPQAAIKIAVDMVNEGLIEKDEALMRVEPDQLDKLLHPVIDPAQQLQILARGLPASPGAAVGKIAFSSDEAEKRAERGEKVVLVRIETSPEDIGGMKAAEGILTARGGMTSHAAVVARGMGKSCVAGCGALNIDERSGVIYVGDNTLGRDDYITINGTTGEVIKGEIKLIRPQLREEFAIILQWADEERRLKIRANADTPRDALVARDFGAQGIGLCRTEHMFFAEDRIFAVREMIISQDEKTRRRALAKLKPMQKADFINIFREMHGLPVTIRLLDPPLHEFLPAREDDIVKLADDMNTDVKRVKQRIAELREFNPMLGHRGCRLGISYPEIYEMQVEAIFEAACEIKNKGINVIPEVMIPLVAHVKELTILKKMVTQKAEEVFKRMKVQTEYTLGTMIEVPRAAVTSDEIAAEADFFSFGTNDLTQMGFGLSRDDAGKFLPTYVELGILSKDPFHSLDKEGIGKLMEISVEKGRKVKPELKLGICGEHGGDPDSIDFCHKLGLDYVSCSPFRVPIARLASAQANIRQKRQSKKK